MNFRINKLFNLVKFEIFLRLFFNSLIKNLLINLLLIFLFYFTFKASQILPEEYRTILLMASGALACTIITILFEQPINQYKKELDHIYSTSAILVSIIFLIGTIECYINACLLKKTDSTFGIEDTFTPKILSTKTSKEIEIKCNDLNVQFNDIAKDSLKLSDFFEKLKDQYNNYFEPQSFLIEEQYERLKTLPEELIIKKLNYYMENLITYKKGMKIINSIEIDQCTMVSNFLMRYNRLIEMNLKLIDIIRKDSFLCYVYFKFPRLNSEDRHSIIYD